MSHWSPFSRRDFVKRTGLAGGGLLLSQLPQVASATEETITPAEPLPTRTLGRTGEEVSLMTLGTAPCGNARGVAPPQIADIVRAAVDLGINSVDTAPAYVKAEEGVGLAMKSKALREKVFLATKVPADTVDEGERSLARSLKLLQTDYVDLLYYHGVGNRQVENALDEDGVFTWLVKQKKAGKCRYVGISGHNLPGRFQRFLETGEVDVILVVINFADYHTYGFEESVLPLAREHNAGIVAMKVLGGARRSAGSYANPNSVGELDARYVEDAFRYALSTEGVATANIGINSIEQLKTDVELVRRFQPLTDEQRAALVAAGKPIAEEWGAHFGPVTEDA